MTTTNKFEFRTFQAFNKFVQERTIVAQRLEETFPDIKFRDSCLSMKGDQRCEVFYADSLRSVTYKCDPNNNTIYVIVNGDD